MYLKGRRKKHEHRGDTCLKHYLIVSDAFCHLLC
uniref:Uncharacterized protein n=1 Tax=Arundo donax TaxID=35708 RepID=A0A0A9C1S6_ARUDO